MLIQILLVDNGRSWEILLVDNGRSWEILLVDNGRSWEILLVELFKNTYVYHSYYNKTLIKLEYGIYSMLFVTSMAR